MTIETRLRRKQIDEDLLVGDMGQTFIWWYEVSFKHQLVELKVWDLVEQIKNLHRIVSRIAGPKNLRRWEEAVWKELEEYASPKERTISGRTEELIAALQRAKANSPNHGENLSDYDVNGKVDLYKIAGMFSERHVG